MTLNTNQNINNISDHNHINNISDQDLNVLNHSASHVMAAAIKKIYPTVKFAIGPAIKNGFYYDFDLDIAVNYDDLASIEKEMKKIINQNLKFEQSYITKEEAKNIFKDNPYKVELINEIKDSKVSIYKTGDFIDLCAGPHVDSTGKIKAFKLLSIAGAYWRGDEKNKMLTRIYGTAFYSKEELDKYIEKIELAKKSDHRVIGKTMELFTFHDEAPGFPFFHPKGMVLQNTILQYWRSEHVKEGYQEIKTPIILSNQLWKISGHWDNYKENMYFVKIDDDDYAVKPMNCVGAILIYKSKQRSYRDFPLRLAELGLVHRHEKSGVLHGLFRVRNFTQDDAHIFCLESQLESEIVKVMNLIGRIYKVFGFDNYHVELSTRPLKRIGSDEIWDKAEKTLKNVVEAHNLNYKINEGEGAFYGPKIDFHIKDCLDRTWQCATIQLDFSMPEKFNLEYTGEDNARHRPVMIHRVVLGSLERFIGILIEHYSGNLPPWLAPVQVIVLPISDKYYQYSLQIYNQLVQKKFRTEIDNRIESLNKKIREAELQKIPYMVIIGEKEVANNTISVRKKLSYQIKEKDNQDIKDIKVSDFIKILEDTVENKKTTP